MKKCEIVNKLVVGSANKNVKFVNRHELTKAFSEIS